MEVRGAFDALMADLGSRQGIRRPGDVGWAHAVNDRRKLELALADPSIAAIESDVSIAPDGRLILAHPPATDSDLGLDELLAAIEASTAVVKLDFKDPRALVPALERLQDASPARPVILNADVLAAGDADPPRFDGAAFISACGCLCPWALLSLGWTTRPEMTYVAADVDRMLGLCAGVGQVTFPIRARGLRASLDEVRRLLRGEGRSLTIWDDVPASPSLRRWLASTLDPGRTFLDLPRGRDDLAAP